MRTLPLLMIAILSVCITGCIKNKMKAQLIDQCTQELPEQVCSCAFDKLEKQIGKDELDRRLSSPERLFEVTPLLTSNLEPCYYGEGNAGR